MRLRILAREAQWDYDPATCELLLELRDSTWTWHGQEQGEEEKVYPGVVPFRLDLDALFPPRPARVEDYTFSELVGLRGVAETLPEGRPSIFRWNLTELEYELHNRLAVALSPLVMALLGMPLGVLVRQRGRLTAFFAAFLPVAAVYYPLSMLGEGLATQGNVAPVAAAWCADAIVGAGGGFLTWRMTFR
jgi:lipopolysaccharide export system permease protein